MPKIDDNGVIREMTEDEVAAMSHEIVPPTREEQNAADIAYLAMMLGVEL